MVGIPLADRVRHKFTAACKPTASSF
jgi:hypothetical protein